MRIENIGILGSVLLAFSCATAGEERPSETEDSEVVNSAPVSSTVVLETTKGEIVLELYPQDAPETVVNFLRYVRGGFYNGLIFHRVMSGFMVQAGAMNAEMVTRSTNIFPIPNEAANGLKNVRGALAMARMTDPHSATSEFFINHADNVVLDFTSRNRTGWGYAVFGQVTSGMEVVDSIAAGSVIRRGSRANFPVDPVTIVRAYVP